MVLFKILRNKNIIPTLYNIKFFNSCLRYNTTVVSQTYTGNGDIKSLLHYWKNIFLQNNIPEPKESIENIIAFNINSQTIIDVYKNFRSILTKEQINNIQCMCESRLQRMPVQYIIGEWDFRELTLKMKPPVFIPRPETEMLIDIILDDVKSMEHVDVLEICCGSGAISLALLFENPKTRVVAIDKSIDACQLTNDNAAMYNLQDRLTIMQALVSDEKRLQEIENTFDVIVSNPPYVLEKDMKHLEPEITKYEDLDALYGGKDGLSVIVPILKISSEKLRNGGCLYLETDPSHPLFIKEFIDNHPNFNLIYCDTFKDFCKKDRFVKIKKI